VTNSSEGAPITEEQPSTKPTKSASSKKKKAKDKNQVQSA